MSYTLDFFIYKYFLQPYERFILPWFERFSTLQVEDHPPRYEQNHLGENPVNSTQNHKKVEYKAMDSINPLVILVWNMIGLIIGVFSGRTTMSGGCTQPSS